MCAARDAKLKELAFRALQMMSELQGPVTYEAVKDRGPFKELYDYLDSIGLVDRFGTAKADNAGNPIPPDASDLWRLYMVPAAEQVLSAGFSQESFDAVYLDLEESLYAEHATWEVWAPLVTFTPNVNSVTLANGVAIRQIGEREKAYLDELASRWHTPPYHYKAVEATHVLSRQLKTSKAGPIPGILEDPHFDVVITALRLAKEGAVSYALAAVSRQGPAFGSWFPLGQSAASWSDTRPLVPGPLYEASVDDLDTLNQLVASLSRRAIPTTVGRALDRFNFSYERRRPEDRLVDCWVALEALLLRNSRDELRFRASLRLARLLGRDPGERQWLYHATRKSYDTRSDVVHGARIPEGIWNVTLFTHEVLRRALRHCVLAGAPPDLEGLDVGAVRAVSEEV